jgi:general secretion pathway protein K
MRIARAQRGIALVTALMIVAIAAAIAVKIAFAHQIWFRQMENVSDRGATDWLRRGALHWASVALLEDSAQNSIDHLGEPWAMSLPTLPVEGGGINVRIEDAQGRFNLNNLFQNTTLGSVPSKTDVAIFERLLQNLGLDPNLANAVVDWIDPDGNVSSPGGAEDIDYLNLKPPYRAANQGLASAEELRLVRGFDAKTYATLLPYVTVLPPGTHYAINVNTASPQVLAALTGLDMSWAQRVVEARADSPMQNIGAFSAKMPQGSQASQVPPGSADVKTSFFLITLNTSIGRHEERTLALMQRSSFGGGGATSVIWHRPEPLIDSVGPQDSSSGGGSQTSTGDNENTQTR